MSNYPAPTDTATPPRTVTVAFWLFLLVVLTHVVGLIVSIAQAPGAAQRAKTQLAHSGTATHGVNVSSLVGVSVVVGIVVAILYILAFILFDYYMRRGRNWARIVLLIVTVLSLTGVLGLYGVGAVGVIAAVVAVILTFLPASNAYFHSVKEQKLRARSV
jgi:hypothetical protein